MIPIKYGHSKKLISHDVNSNTYNYKYTFSVEVVPVCKDNVVALPRQLAHQLGGIGQVIVVNKVHQVWNNTTLAQLYLILLGYVGSSLDRP